MAQVGLSDGQIYLVPCIIPREIKASCSLSIISLIAFFLPIIDHYCRSFYLCPSPIQISESNPKNKAKKIFSWNCSVISGPFKCQPLNGRPYCIYLPAAKLWWNSFSRSKYIHTRPRFETLVAIVSSLVDGNCISQKSSDFLHVQGPLFSWIIRFGGTINSIWSTSSRGDQILPHFEKYSI